MGKGRGKRFPLVKDKLKLPVPGEHAAGKVGPVSTSVTKVARDHVLCCNGKDFLGAWRLQIQRSICAHTTEIDDG
jgi:hypothetical protein